MTFHEFKTQFFQHHTNRKELVKEIKTYFQDFNSLQKFVTRYKKELKSAGSLLNNALLGHYFLPKDYSKLATSEEQYYTGSLEQEMNWQVLSFLECSQIINDFIKLRNEFEHNFLIGNYENARIILNKIELEICVSYWSIENRFIIDEYQFGSEKNWETRNQVLDDKNNAFVQLFGNLFSFKTEKRVSFFQYNEDFNNWLETEGLNNSKELKGLVEYFRFYGNYFLYSKYNHLAELLYRESNTSIIDRYIFFIRLSQYSICELTNTTDYLVLLLNELRLKIQDISLNQMVFSIDSLSVLPESDINYEVLNIIDEYSVGHYELSKELSKGYLLNHKSNYIELLEIYSKSLVEINSEYEGITLEESFLNDISLCYYNILQKNSFTDSALVDLVKLSYVFSNSHIGVHLYSFINEQLGWQSEISYSFLENLNSKFINPRLLSNLYQQGKIGSSFLINLTNNLKKSTTVNIFTVLHESYYKKETQPNFNGVPEYKNIIYNIRLLMINEKTEECIKICENLINEDNLSIIARYEIVSCLFACYLKNTNYRNCIILFVNIYLFNSHLTKKMRVNELAIDIIKNKFKNLGDKSALIELPIFLKINSTDKIKIKQAYEMFLSANKFTKPSELFNVENEISKVKLIYFLKYVCIPEILQLSKYFNSTYEVNEERISIVKYLTEIDDSDVNAYKTEIAELTQKNTISKVIGGIDERKIFVNEYKIRQNIKKSEKQNILQSEQISPLTNESFERYIKLLDYVRNNNEYKDVSSIIQFGDNGEVTFLELEKDKTYQEEDIDIVLYLPAFRIFVTYFLNIRDLFIFSKEFGLDAYLSTRIRHGTLPNHLRSVFETYSLITAQTDNVYAENQHWIDKFDLPKDSMSFLQSVLGDFSLNIDGFSKEIKDKFIQCRNEKRNQNTNALFDYSYTEEDLILLFISDFNESKNIDDFIDKSFQELWKRTELNLEQIRTKFNNDFRDKYIAMIDKLQSEILTAMDKQTISELLNNLMTCRTEIQTKLSNISKWFRRSESSFEGEYEMQILADTSIQITKNLNPSFHFEIEKEICQNFNVIGEYHQHIIDLMNNCMFNIVKHSHMPCESLDAKLTIKEVGDNLILNFENRISDPSIHVDKLTAIKENWKSADADISKEGGTGFPKIKKIIHSDLNRKFSAFEFSLNENKLNIILSFETNGLKV